jgi:uncharacterized SAM-binding protein YcdF (DUF218 family)
MRVAVRTLATYDGGRLVVSGQDGEAERLADLAPQGVDVVIESMARSTLENVQRSLPYLLDAERLAIATDRFHRRRAVRYLRDLEPGLLTRLVHPTYSWREGWWMDGGGAVYESLLRIRRASIRLRTRRRHGG